MGNKKTKITVEDELDDVQLLIACAFAVGEAHLLDGPPITRKTVLDAAATMYRWGGADFRSTWISYPEGRMMCGKGCATGIGCVLFKKLFKRMPPKKQEVRIHWQYPETPGVVTVANDYMKTRSQEKAVAERKKREAKERQEAKRAEEAKREFEKSWSG